MAHKKVLIITYYWPPAGGGGVQRWLKFSKYLREFEWEPVIYTAKDAEYPVIDESLEKELPEDLEVIRTPIWEPYDLYKKFTRRKKEERVYSGFINELKKESLAQKLSIFIRGNFFIPDARKFWINPSIKFLEKYLKSNPVDAIISTGPPHSTHLIALAIKRKMNLPWITDFRDPWTNIDFYDQLRLTKLANHRHKKLEKKVLLQADKVVTVSWSWAVDFRRICGREDIEVITNGFDPTDYEETTKANFDKFTICHIGSMNKDRNPEILWKVLADLSKTHSAFKGNFEILLIGQVDYSIVQSIHQYQLQSYLKKIDFLPHHEAINALQRAHLLLLPINSTPNLMGVLPGKLYEYLGAKKPILCIGPKRSDVERIINETQAGSVFDYQDRDGIQSFLATQMTDNGYQQKLITEKTSKYSRFRLAGVYAELLQQLI